MEGRTDGKKSRFYFSIFIWSGICLLLMSLIGSFMYDAFHTPSEFNKLDVKEGVLTQIGKCIYRKRGLSYIPAEITVNGKNEKVKLPCGQQVSLLSDKIGEVIEIRSDPRNLSFLASDLNVWHVASNKRIYFDYKMAIRKYIAGKQNDQNIIYISIAFTVILILKNFGALKVHISRVLARDHTKPIELKDEIVFEPSNINYGLMLWSVSIPTIMCTYYGFFVYPIFLLFAVPLAAGVFSLYWAMRRNTHLLRLSPIGIGYEPFRKAIGTDNLRWEEVEHIGTLELRGAELILIRLLNKEKRRSVFSSLSGDLTIVLSRFSNKNALKQAIFQMYSSCKDNNR